MGWTFYIYTFSFYENLPMEYNRFICDQDRNKDRVPLFIFSNQDLNKTNKVSCNRMYVISVSNPYVFSNVILISNTSGGCITNPVKTIV